MTEEASNEKKWPKKKLIKAIVTIVIIALLIVSIFIFISKNNANSQIDRFSESIENGDADALAEILSTNERNMTKSEAENLITYFKTNENPKRLKNTLDEVKNNLDSDNSTSHLGTLKDKNGKPVISFSKNGKHLFILDKISIEPHYRDIYIKELDNKATYRFDKKHEVPVDGNKLNKLGSFIVGDYDVSVKKKFKNGSVKGSIDGIIHINTDEVNKNDQIVAEQKFNQTKISVKLHNDSKLKSKSTKLLINNEVTSLKKDNIYGYFPNEQPFTVQAKGELKGHSFRTNKVEVLQGTTANSHQVVNLRFDEKAINKAVKEDEKVKQKLSKFIKEYMDDLNKAYKNTEYSEISSYIKEDSSAEKFMKPKFKDKQSIKYTDTSVKKVEKEGDMYKLHVHKKYKNYDVNNIYHVKIENDEPEIVEIDDK